MTVIEGDPYTPRSASEDTAKVLEDAAQVLEEAATVGQPYGFDLGGQRFTLRAEVDMRVLVALQRGQFARALDLALAGGARDVDRILASDEPLTPDAFGEVVQAWMKAATGATPGESPASPS